MSSEDISENFGESHIHCKNLNILNFSES